MFFFASECAYYKVNIFLLIAYNTYDTYNTYNTYEHMPDGRVQADFVREGTGEVAEDSGQGVLLARQRREDGAVARIHTNQSTSIWGSRLLISLSEWCKLRHKSTHGLC